MFIVCSSVRLFDCSTVDVERARAVAEMVTSLGHDAIDAPASGGTVGAAAAGTLTFMAGGSKDAFARAVPLFEIMGQKALHCGDAGAGQVAKVCNNMILGVAMIATCDAFALADKPGLDQHNGFGARNEAVHSISKRTQSKKSADEGKRHG